jgi:hypothetical protein
MPLAAGQNSSEKGAEKIQKASTLVRSTEK